MKIGRNDACPCGSKKKYKKCCMLNKEMTGYKYEQPAAIPEIDKSMTENFQEQIRNSPKWAKIVEEYGEEKAEKLLKECKAELK